MTFTRQGVRAPPRPILGLCAGLLVALSACTSPAPAPPAIPPQPEGASGLQPKPGWRATRHAVAAAHPLAAEAGREILRQGGAAIDAAIATQMVLGLVEPQSSGIGGGAFLLHWDGRRVQAYDGRETAPAAVDERLFLEDDGRPMALQHAIVGGRSVGVPGVLRMLEQAHRQHGRLPWARLFEPAIALAEAGFPVGERLHALLADERALRDDPRARAHFYTTDGAALPVGTRLRNPDYAAVLRDIAGDGSRALHEGPLAERIVAAVQAHAGNPGRLSAPDLATYRAQERAPICHRWRRYLVCGMPPPSSGALTIAQILALTDLAWPPSRTTSQPWDDPGWLHVYLEASRLAFADRGRYIGDPDFVAPPGGSWHRLLDDAYLAQRAALIGPQSMGVAAPGLPAGVTGWPAAAASPELPSTTQVSIVDDDGEAVSMTSTIESQFGSRVMVNSGRGLAGGFLLNNQLTDFSFSPRDQGRPAANRVEPGKRPRSSMSPTLVFEREAAGDALRLVLVTGSPGGPLIVHYTAKTILATLGWALSPQAAADLPNFGSLNGPSLLEADRFSAGALAGLRSRGHDPIEIPLTSGVHLLRREPDGSWLGGADPRREGIVAVD